VASERSTRTTAVLVTIHAVQGRRSARFRLTDLNVDHQLLSYFLEHDPE